MAENKTAKNAAPAAAEETVETVDHKKREHKVSRWTLEACMHASKRFDSVDAWRTGHPSSFKAATARGYAKDCCAHMTTKTMTKTAAKAPAKAKTAKPQKTKKGGGRAA